MLGHSIVSQHFMEPEGSITNSRVSTLSQTNPGHITPSHLSKIHQLYYSSTYVLVFLVVTFPLAFPPIIYKRSSSPHTCYMTRPSHPPRLDYSNYTWRRVQITKLLVMQFLHSPVTSSLFGPNILLSTLFSNTLSLCSSLNVRDQVSHPYRTTGKYIPIFKFLTAGEKTEDSEQNGSKHYQNSISS
jgi:hypothetical protein